VVAARSQALDRVHCIQPHGLLVQRTLLVRLTSQTTPAGRIAFRPESVRVFFYTLLVSRFAPDRHVSSYLMNA